MPATRGTSKPKTTRSIRPRSSGKFNARKTPFGNRIYDSALEARYAAELDLKQRAGLIRSWTPQVSIPIRVEGQLICTHIVDFQVVLTNGKTEWHECKGQELPVWKLKKKLIEALYPTIPYVVIR